MTLLLVAAAAMSLQAQQPASHAGSMDRGLQPTQGTVVREDAPASPPSSFSRINNSTQPSSETGNLPGDLRKQAARRFLAQRGIQSAPPAGTIARLTSRTRAPAESMRLARAQHQQLLRQAAPRPDLATPGIWQPLGPAQVTTAAYGAVTGRITSLAADPADSTGGTVYLGATGGGVWKSVDAAGPAASVSFTPLTDNLPVFTANVGPFGGTLSSISIGALSVDPNSPSILLAGTGDINDALDSYYGVGILRSADGGLTWTLIGGSKDALNGGLQNYAFTGNGFAGFAWSTVNPTLAVAAVAQSAEGVIVNASIQGAEAGLYYSTDSGQTWYLAVIEDDATDIVQSPHKAYAPPGNSVTSVVWNPVRQRFYAAVRFHGYYESTDGITWTRLANQPGASLAASACPTNPGEPGQTSCPIFRGALAVQPVTGDLFALTTDLNNLDQGLYQDVCSTSGLAVTSCASATVTFGRQIDSGALENGSGDTTIPLADYDLTLAAVPSQQDTILFAGTEDIYRCSLASSCAWRNTTNIQTCAAAQVAPSQHATESTFGSTGLLYFANDGGLWRSTDTVAQTGSVCSSTDASHYQNLNGGIGSLAEISHFSVSPNSATTLLAAMGGFGTVGTTTAQGAWQQILTGEGSYTAIDPGNTQLWYTEAGSGVDIFRCADGANCDASSFGTTPAIDNSQVSGDADYFFDAAPWILDPLNRADILLGTCRVWRGVATGGWTSADLLSPMLDGNQQPACTSNAQLRSIGAGLDANVSSGSEQIYAGMAGPYDGGSTIPGHIFGSTVPANGGLTTWTDLYNSPVTNATQAPQFNPGGFSVSSIAVDPHDATGQTLYVTMQGFSGYGISGAQVYGSTDGGAHWLNLNGSSLPNAPANSIVVDPNVPSILYLAMDTGVYYTQNVAACADQTQNCWTVYGSNLPNAPVTNLQVFSAGSHSILEASTYGRGIWTIPLLTSPAQGTLSPAAYSFGDQQAGSSSPTVSFTLLNTGTTSMSIAAIQASANYTETNNCGQSLAVSSSCTIQVAFAPTLTGDLPGTLTVYANVSGGYLTSTLDGTGLAPGTTTPTPSSLTFAAQAVGTTSLAQAVTIQNTGDVAVQLQPLTVTVDYQISANTCGASLASGASCVVSIVFAPTGYNDRPGQLSIPSNLPGSPVTVPLDGTGVLAPALTLSPTSLTFPNTMQGAVSAQQAVTVTNTGGAVAQLQSVTVAGDYSITASSCGSTLAANTACVLQIIFAPVASCSRAGLLTVAANVQGGLVTAALSGAGVNGATPCGLTFAPPSLSFPSVTTGSSSPAETITVTNSAAVPAQLGSLAALGNYSIQGGTCLANLTLNPADSCTLQIAFSPTAAGDRAGLLTVPSNLPEGLDTASLDGGGVLPGQLALSTSLLSFSPTLVGSVSAAQTVTLSNTGGSSLLLQPATISPEYQLSSNTCANISYLDVGQSCALTIAFAPTAAGDQPGVLTTSANGGAVQSQASLDGSGIAPVTLVFTPASLAFGSVQEYKTSPPQSAILTNSGGRTAQLVAPVITGDYALAGNTCGAMLAPSASCTLQLTFTPTALGSRPGSVVVGTADNSGSATLSLSGTGPSLVLTPTSLVFGATAQGATTAGQNITIADVGSSAVNLQPFTITGDFAISADNCSGTPLNPTYSCPLSITFTPTAGGQRTGLLTISSSTETHTATLTGTGLSPATDTLSTTSLTFGPQLFGTISAAQSVTLTNSGGSTLHAISTTITGPFQSTNNCSTLLGGGLSCSIAVTFAPTGAGVETGQLTISDSLHSQVVTLSGQGILSNVPYPSAVATPLSLDFGGYADGATTPAQVVTVTNNGNVSLSGFTAATTGSNFAIAANTCGDTLAIGANCTLGITFSPQQPGNVGGNVTLKTPSLSDSLTVGLSGSGEDFNLSVAGSSSDLVTNGQTASYQVVVTPVGSSAGSLSVTCSGAPANSTCTVNPATLTVSGGATGSITVTVATGVANGAARPGTGQSLLWRAGATLALLLPCLLLRGSTRRAFLVLLLSTALVVLPSACGVHASSGSSASSTGGSGTTPPGKYAITVTASFPGAQRSVTLTLTVE